MSKVFSIDAIVTIGGNGSFRVLGFEQNGDEHCRNTGDHR